MSKKVGKFLCVVLSALTAFTLCLTGCGSETGGNSGKPQTPGGDEPGQDKTYLSESDYPREKMSVSACGNVDGYLPSHVCTENPNAYWRADERACSYDGGHYLIVQLQSEQIVTGIKYMTPSDFTGAFTECEVLYGHDGVSFKSAGVSQWKKDASEKTLVFSEPVKAKYIKLVGDGTTCAEITVRVEVDTPESLVGYVDTLAGKVEKGATIAGPTMPNGSIHPSPETLNRENGGYTTGQNVVGFGQLYAQGTGGHQSYGNFLLSPQVGNIQTDEKNHASPVSYERGTANYYSANLDKYGIFAEVTPAKNAAMYRFSYPQSDSAALLLDISRKIG